MANGQIKATAIQADDDQRTHPGGKKQTTLLAELQALASKDSPEGTLAKAVLAILDVVDK